VEDLDAASEYCIDRLGWQPLLAVPGEVAFLQVAPGVALSLFNANGFGADTGEPLRYPFTLARNVAGDQDVREVVARMVQACGTVLKEPQRAEWGGYHGFVADPAGLPWEIAHNPGWAISDDGTVRMGGVDA
jgi:catechol 2,3-dioxygenase-like lactoylglutathione lyase family enzyme